MSLIPQTRTITCMPSLIVRWRPHFMIARRAFLTVACISWKHKSEDLLLMAIQAAVWRDTRWVLVLW
jgi:hypothetical protein